MSGNVSKTQPWKAGLGEEAPSVTVCNERVVNDKGEVISGGKNDAEEISHDNGKGTAAKDGGSISDCDRAGVKGKNDIEAMVYDTGAKTGLKDGRSASDCDAIGLEGKNDFEEVLYDTSRKA